MTCLSRYAEAWEYSAFWCNGTLLRGVDRSGGGPNADLFDSQIDFRKAGIKPNQGMVLYNLTTGLSGVVTAVTENNLTATGVTWTDGDIYRIVSITGTQIAAIENFLEIVTPDVTIALQSAGACDCTLSAAGTALVKKLTIIESGLFYSCPCGEIRISDDQRIALNEFITTTLENIRNGTLELCDGETGGEWPAFGWAEQSLTEFAANQIVLNRINRTGS